ncbi:hypothetical protein A9K55_001496 [Cordyceps militaris]|uniref:Uncharacterized protein n=1 Tax=Cordyceps militaris TaxID=73501 RepID=A0A2H4SRD1_CORMI|nr:hypothetical protein A9K55_001496 [Cordyceps militaris]
MRYMDSKDRHCGHGGYTSDIFSLKASNTRPASSPRDMNFPRSSQSYLMAVSNSSSGLETGWTGGTHADARGLTGATVECGTDVRGVARLK